MSASVRRRGGKIWSADERIKHQSDSYRTAGGCDQLTLFQLSFMSPHVLLVHHFKAFIYSGVGESETPGFILQTAYTVLGWSMCR